MAELRLQDVHPKGKQLKKVGDKDLTKALLVLDTRELGYDMQAP